MHNNYLTMEPSDDMERVVVASSSSQVSTNQENLAVITPNDGHESGGGRENSRSRHLRSSKTHQRTHNNNNQYKTWKSKRVWITPVPSVIAPTTTTTLPTAAKSVSSTTTYTSHTSSSSSSSSSNTSTVVKHVVNSVSSSFDKYLDRHSHNNYNRCQGIQTNVELYLNDSLIVPYHNHHNNHHNHHNHNNVTSSNYYAQQCLIIMNELKSAVQHTIDQLMKATCSKNHHENHNQTVNIDLLLVRFPDALYRDHSLLRIGWFALEQVFKSFGRSTNNNGQEDGHAASSILVKRLGLYNVYPSQLQSIMDVATIVRPSVIEYSWDFVVQCQQQSSHSNQLALMQELCQRYGIPLVPGGTLEESVKKHDIGANNVNWLTHYSVIQPDSTLLLLSGVLFPQK